MDLALTSDFDSSLLPCWDSASSAAANAKNERKGVGDRNVSNSPRSSNSKADGEVSWESCGSTGFAPLTSFNTMLEEEENKINLNTSSECDRAEHGIALNEDGAGCNDPHGNSSGAPDPGTGLKIGASANTSSEPWIMTQKNQQEVQVASSPSPSGCGVEGDNGIPAASVVSASMKDAASTSSNVSSSHRHRHYHHHNLSTKNPLPASSHGCVSNPNPPPASLQQAAPESASHSQTTQMHPLAIPSSANCPPHVVTEAHAAHATQMQQAAGMQNTLFPLALTTLGGNSTAAYGAGMSFPTNDGANMARLTSTGGNSSINTSVSDQNSNSNVGQQQQVKTNSMLFPSQTTSTQQPGSDDNMTTTPPPFYLFDAPIELRVNFMQSQRMHGLPVTEDNNSYHYGVAVNGFHPQLSGQGNSSTSMFHHSSANNNGSGSSSSGSHNASSSTVQLVDARHGNRKAGRIKNEREQRRAQKITELIDQLREKMETGGWKVEIKSKFHTLSS
mgnify:CR=1 FL=1